MKTYYLIGDVRIARRSAARAEYAEQRRRGLYPTVLRVVETDETLAFLDRQNNIDAEFVANWPGGRDEAIAIVNGRL